MNISYREQLNKLSGDTVAIMVKHATVPLSGLVSIVDWRLNATISNLIIGKKYKAKPGETLLLNTQQALGIPKTLIIGVGKGYKNELSNALKGLRTKNLSLVVSEELKKDQQQFLTELQNNNIKWSVVTSDSIGKDDLITIKDIEY